MACTHYLPGERESELKEELDAATRILCEMVKRYGAPTPEIEAWRVKHEEMDKRRLEAEEREKLRREQQRLEDAAVAKFRRFEPLTEEEKMLVKGSFTKKGL